MDRSGKLRWMDDELFGYLLFVCVEIFVWMECFGFWFWYVWIWFQDFEGFPGFETCCLQCTRATPCCFGLAALALEVRREGGGATSDVKGVSSSG